MTSVDLGMPDHGLYWDEEANDGVGARISTHSTGRKVCSSCSVDYALSGFTPRKSSPDGYRDQCKKCRSEILGLTRKIRSRERLLHETRICKTCSSPLKYKEETGRFNTYCDECRKLRQRCRRVGITVKQYWKMYNEQQGLCLLCSYRPVEAIDHNYLTLGVRGLLCNGCNLLAGWAAQQGELAVSRLEKYLVSN